MCFMKANQKQWHQSFILTLLQRVVVWQMWGSQRSILRWKIHTRGFEVAAVVFLSLPRLTWTIYNPRSVRHHLWGEWTQCGQSVLLTTCVCSRPSPYSSHVHTEWGRLWKSPLFHSYVSISMCPETVLKLIASLLSCCQSVDRNICQNFFSKHQSPCWASSCQQWINISVCLSVSAFEYFSEMIYFDEI